MNGDLISREALRKTICGMDFDFGDYYDHTDEIIDRICEKIDNAQAAELQWIPITMRPIEEDEKIDFPDATFMFDCHMPENGEEILITTKYGVEFDTCYNDYGYYLDSNRSWDEVLAWMPLPEAYKKGGAE